MTFTSGSKPTIATKPKDVQVAAIAPQTTVLRSRTWDQLKFEVEYARQRGTTANSYLIQADRIALLDPPGESFTELYLAELQQHITLAKLDYIILSHVNPNRMATLKVLVELAPQASLICSRAGANTLRTTFPSWDRRILPVRGEEALDLGQGHHLQFIAVPTPRWADGLCTYDPATRILFTDKFFGVHICGDAVFDESWKQLDGDRRYYFDCLHAAQSKQVETVLEKFSGVSAQCYAPGHGPIVRFSLSRLNHDYYQWCQQQQRQEFNVALFYASAYGNTASLASAITQGLIQAGVAVQSINCEFTDADEITQALAVCDGFIIGSPTLGGHAPTQIQTALGLILSGFANNKLAGVFGSYGWSGEAIDVLETKLRDANFRFGFEPIRVQFSPNSMTLQACEDAGAEFAQALRRARRSRVPKLAIADTQVDRTAQGVGRIIGSLCVLTYSNGNTHCGFLTSRISQATFNPPGLMIAVDPAQTPDMLFQPGDRFVLNILKEGRNLRRYFSTRIVQGDNPFLHLATHTASNGCLILDDGLAYLECTVQNRMECGDHWLVYVLVEAGQVLDTNGITAIQYSQSNSRSLMKSEEQLRFTDILPTPPTAECRDS